MNRTLEMLEQRRLMAGDMMIATDLIVRDIVITHLFYPVTVDGTAGNDSITVSRDGLGNLNVNNNGVVSSYPEWQISKVIVNAGAGNDTVSGYWSNTPLEVNAGLGADNVYGSQSGDVVYGGGGQDYIYGYAGNDTLDGGAVGTLYGDNNGNDYVGGGEGNDTLSASDWGTCTLDGGNGDDYAYGGNYNDIVYGSGGNDRLYGGPGNDTVEGYTGDDVMYGDDGNDTLRGQWGNDSIVAGAGNDLVYGDDGHDYLWGFAGDDKIYAGGGDDLVLAGDGNDTIVTIGGGQYDTLYGEGGFDSFWCDSEVTEQIRDADGWEIASGNVHRVGGFMEERFTNGSWWPGNWTYQTPSRELLGQNFRDPDGGSNHANFSNRPLFASTGPVAGDVRQGQVGDCYFLAPLSSVARHNPNKIRQSVVELGDGTYAVRFFSGGSERYLRVDGDLARNSSNGLEYAKLGTGNSNWVAIMEKAWAHFRRNEGSYGSIASGWMDECYSALGSSTATLDVSWWYKTWNNANDLWNYVCDRLVEGRSVTVGTHDSPTSLMVGSHAYMVESVYFDGVNKMVRLRNPWGYDGGSTTDSNPGDAMVTVTAQQLFDSITKVQSAYV